MTHADWKDVNYLRESLRSAVIEFAAIRFDFLKPILIKKAELNRFHNIQQSRIWQGSEEFEGYFGLQSMPTLLVEQV